MAKNIGEGMVEIGDKCVVFIELNFQVSEVFSRNTTYEGAVHFIIDNSHGF